MNNIIDLIFDNKPFQWGLRGDPFLWEAIKKEVSIQGLPDSKEEFNRMVKDAFIKLVGQEPKRGENYFVEEFDKGGMSSGHVSCDFWLGKGFDLLGDNYLKEVR